MHRVDWTYGADHVWDAHKVTIAEATEAFDDVDAVWFDPDPKTKTGRSIRVIGYSPSRQQILTIILVRDPTVDWLWGANGWPSNSTDRGRHREGSQR